MEAFAQPALLGGLLLIGVPVLIHLLMRQKPKRLLFPALRFLALKHRTNQRKMQLRHLLLLALRMLLLALACLALTGPRIHNDQLKLVGDQPRAAVVVIDTSPSMEYKSAGKSRLDEARRLALELLDELPPASRVAVLDTASPGGDWESVTAARGRISGLQVQAANYPVTSQLAHAYDLFAKLNKDGTEARKGLVPFLFVFSDRTEASWDRNQVPTLKRLRDRAPEPVNAAFVDVGVDKAEDLAITDLELSRQAVAPEEPVRISARVKATNRSADIAVVCELDGDVMERKPVKLEPGRAELVTFEKAVSTPGPHHVRVKFEVADASLTFNDERFATFEVRGGRRVLTITDEPRKARQRWQFALQVPPTYASDLKTPAEVLDWGQDDFARYQAVCLLQVSPEAPGFRNLWMKLYDYVRAGGGLAIIPGGEAMNTPEGRGAYNDAEAQKLMPGRLKEAVRAEDKEGALLDWDRADYKHAFLIVLGKKLSDWFTGDPPRYADYIKPELGPRAIRYWQVEPKPNQASPIINYAGPARWPAVIERRFDSKEEVRGRVLLITTPLDDRYNGVDDLKERWTNYLAVEPSFYLFLIKQTIGYLVGDDRSVTLNFQCGQSVVVPVPAAPRLPRYTIQGPELIGADATATRDENENEVRVPQATQRGSYTLLTDEGQKVVGFSLNDAPEESVLDPRVPKDQIEDLFGPDSVLTLDYRGNLHDTLEQRWSRPVELFPLLMILLLLALAVENLLANKFYRRETQEEVPAVKVPDA
ncbi:hypothetical protein AYO40_05095, partial [Planctomycetaceae bacterium SCGC AG-212-D15]